MTTNTTPEIVLTHATEPRGFRLCRCNNCGLASRCTPDNDYYTRSEDEAPKPLYCERCLVIVSGSRCTVVVPYADTTHPEAGDA